MRISPLPSFPTHRVGGDLLSDGLNLGFPQRAVGFKIFLNSLPPQKQFGNQNVAFAAVGIKHNTVVSQVNKSQMICRHLFPLNYDVEQTSFWTSDLNSISDRHTFLFESWKEKGAGCCLPSIKFRSRLLLPPLAFSLFLCSFWTWGKGEVASPLE